jgi:hypothetical protein
MKLRIASLITVVLVAFVAIPGTAQTVYSNGPINGNTDAWTINFGFIVSDTFNVANNGTTITGASFGLWLMPGDPPLSSVALSITSGENGGTSYFDQTVNITQGACTLNQFGYDVCVDSTTFNGPTLNVGTYWLNLQQSCDQCGGPAYWDENSGPSQASENSIGSIPSEAFTLFGSSTSTSTTATVPEPSSILLFGSGFLGLAGFLRRCLF